MNVEQEMCFEIWMGRCWAEQWDGSSHSFVGWWRSGDAIVVSRGRQWPSLPFRSAWAASLPGQGRIRQRRVFLGDTAGAA